jgi:hypothetical protein
LRGEPGGEPLRVDAEGDVLARFDAKAIDDAVAAAERDLHSTEVRHQNARDQARLDDEGAAQRIEAASDAANDAQEALANYEKVDVVLKKRGDDLNESYGKDNIDDQKDELAQLEKMYKADELVDATEEIVLKRAKRRLAISGDARELSGDRRKYRVDFDEAMQTEVKQEAVHTQEQSLDRLVRNQAIEKRAREDALVRSKDALDLQNQKTERLKRDREKFAIQAPRDGILLHGKEKDYRPGRTPTRYERGSTLPARTDLFLVADPDTLAVAVDVPESMLKEVHEGAAVEVQIVALPGEGAPGTLHIEPYPSAKGGSEENGYEATAKLDHAIPGVLFGMRAKVKLAGAAPKDAAPKDPAAGAKATP